MRTTLYFYLTLLLVCSVVIYVYRPFDPFPLPSRRETFLDPKETYIEDQEVRQMTKVPSGVQSSLSLTIEPYAVGTQGGKSDSKRRARVADSFIKSSFNSVWDGAKCSIPMMTYVISRGCRFLDFEVFVYLDAKADRPQLVVANGGNMRDNRSILKGSDVLQLSEVLKFAVTNAFSSSISPAATDPLFLHFRVQADEKYSAFLQSTFRGAVDSAIPSSRRLRASELPKMSIGDMRNKVAVFVDSITCPWLVGSEFAENCVTAFTGTPQFPLMKYGGAAGGDDDPNIGEANAGKTKVTPSAAASSSVMGVVAIPSRETLNVLDAMFTSSASIGSYEMRSLAKYPAITFLAMPFYQNNSALYEMETFFNQQKSACPTKTAALAYVEEKTGENL